MSISALPLGGLAWPLKPLEMPEGVLLPSGSPQSSSSTQEQQLGALNVLPRLTRVRITGNNRCAPRLIGLEATVKRANGLGGWHFLSVVPTGEEIKLQRNALQVLELGPEESQESSDEDEPLVREAVPTQPEVLHKPRIRRLPRQLSPVPDIFKPSRPASSSPSGSGRSGHSSRAVAPSIPESLDLSKLDAASLRRYRRVHQLDDVDAAAPKEELASAANRHFRSQLVIDESGVLLAFCAALRRRSVTG